MSEPYSSSRDFLRSRLIELIPEPSATPLTAFTSLAEQLLAAEMAGVNVELVDRQSLVRFVLPSTDEPQPVPTRPETQDLFAGDGATIRTATTVAVAIQSVTHEDPGQRSPKDQFLGAVICDFPPGHEPTDFDAVILTSLVARWVGIVQSERLTRDRIDQIANLQTALASNREIGTAMGLLMAEQGLRADGAFDELRTTSQRCNRKVRDLAADIIATHDATVATAHLRVVLGQRTADERDRVDATA